LGALAASTAWGIERVYHLSGTAFMQDDWSFNQYGDDPAIVSIEVFVKFLFAMKVSVRDDYMWVSRPRIYLVLPKDDARAIVSHKRDSILCSFDTNTIRRSNAFCSYRSAQIGDEGFVDSPSEQGDYPRIHSRHPFREIQGTDSKTQCKIERPREVTPCTTCHQQYTAS
jgi:hypothetical protein